MTYSHHSLLFTVPFFLSFSTFKINAAECESPCLNKASNPLEQIKNDAIEGIPGVRVKKTDPSDVFHEIDSDSTIQKVVEIHDDGQYTSICWTEITTVKEYKNGTKTAMREYAITLETLSDIPEEFVDSSPNSGEIVEYDIFDTNTKKSKKVSFTTVSEVNNVTIRENRHVSCGSGPIFTKQFMKWPTSNKKKIEIRVSPKQQSLIAMGCVEKTATRSLIDHVQQRTVQYLSEKKSVTTSSTDKDLVTPENDSNTTEIDDDSFEALPSDLKIIMTKIRSLSNTTDSDFISAAPELQNLIGLIIQNNVKKSTVSSQIYETTMSKQPPVNNNSISISFTPSNFSLSELPTTESAKIINRKGHKSSIKNGDKPLIKDNNNHTTVSALDILLKLSPDTVKPENRDETKAPISNKRVEVIDSDHGNFTKILPMELIGPDILNKLQERIKILTNPDQIAINTILPSKNKVDTDEIEDAVIVVPLNDSDSIPDTFVNQLFSVALPHATETGRYPPNNLIKIMFTKTTIGTVIEENFSPMPPNKSEEKTRSENLDEMVFEQLGGDSSDSAESDEEKNDSSIFPLKSPENGRRDLPFVGDNLRSGTLNDDSSSDSIEDKKIKSIIRPSNVMVTTDVTNFTDFLINNSSSESFEDFVLPSDNKFSVEVVKYNEQESEYSASSKSAYETRSTSLLQNDDANTLSTTVTPSAQDLYINLIAKSSVSSEIPSQNVITSSVFDKISAEESKRNSPQPNDSNAIILLEKKVILSPQVLYTNSISKSSVSTEILLQSATTPNVSGKLESDNSNNTNSDTTHSVFIGTIGGSADISTAIVQFPEKAGKPIADEQVIIPSLNLMSTENETIEPDTLSESKASTSLEQSSEFSKLAQYLFANADNDTTDEFPSELFDNIDKIILDNQSDISPFSSENDNDGFRSVSDGLELPDNWPSMLETVNPTNASNEDVLSDTGDSFPHSTKPEIVTKVIIPMNTIKKDILITPPTGEMLSPIVEVTDKDERFSHLTKVEIVKEVKNSPNVLQLQVNNKPTTSPYPYYKTIPYKSMELVTKSFYVSSEVNTAKNKSDILVTEHPPVDTEELKNPSTTSWAHLFNTATVDVDKKKSRSRGNQLKIIVNSQFSENFTFTATESIAQSLSSSHYESENQSLSGAGKGTATVSTGSTIFTVPQMILNQTVHRTPCPKHKIVVKVKIILEHVVEGNVGESVYQAVKPILEIEKQTEFEPSRKPDDLEITQTVFEEQHNKLLDIGKDLFSVMNDEVDFTKLSGKNFNLSASNLTVDGKLLSINEATEQVKYLNNVLIMCNLRMPSENAKWDRNTLVYAPGNGTLDKINKSDAVVSRQNDQGLKFLVKSTYKEQFFVNNSQSPSTSIEPERDENMAVMPYSSSNPKPIVSGSSLDKLNTYRHQPMLEFRNLELPQPSSLPDNLDAPKNKRSFEPENNESFLKMLLQKLNLLLENLNI